VLVFNSFILQYRSDIDSSLKKSVNGLPRSAFPKSERLLVPCGLGKGARFSVMVCPDLVNTKGNAMTQSALILYLAFLLTTESALAQELKKISLGYPSLAFTQSHIWVAKEEGLFGKVRTRCRSGFSSRRASGDSGFGGGRAPIINVGTVSQANLSGYNLVLVATMETRYYFLVFVRPDISRLDQLKGKTRDQWIWLQYALRRANHA
jgi:hypothetical protein